MLEVNALLSAQSKNIATEPRFHRRSEDSRQHSSAELDLSAERQECPNFDRLTGYGAKMTITLCAIAFCAALTVVLVRVD
jgi:hypothetical protein